MTNAIPKLSDNEVHSAVKIAKESPRKRYHKILHEKGAVFNAVFNFMDKDSYMQPHLHPGDEKIEEIHVMEGILGMIFFEDDGAVSEYKLLGKGYNPMIAVPAFKYHTYVILSDYVVTYETMKGVYEPGTWKKMASWAPEEGSLYSMSYFSGLKSYFQVKE
jgi:cupin fold WbuC family metalloprotein